MYKVVLYFFKSFDKGRELHLYDGPDFHSKQYKVQNGETFISSSFQVAVILPNFNIKQNLAMWLQFLIEKNQLPNYTTYFIQRKTIVHNTNSRCTKNTTVLCAFEFNVTKGLFVNVTILFLKYTGPNVGYCKYGGLSVYISTDSVIQEVLLMCDTLHTLNSIISTSESMFLILYSYFPYSEIKITLEVKPTQCKGVHVLR